MTLVLVALVCLAGFLVYPVVMGFYAWSPARPDSLWPKMVAWSLAVAALLLVNVAYLWPETPPDLLGPLLSLRHVLVGLTAVAILLVVDELSDGVPRVLLWGMIVFLAVRAVLWFATDMVWAHGFTANGTALYGPLRTPFVLLVTALLTLVAILAVLHRPWKSELARRGLLFAILPGLVLGAVVQAPGQVGEVAAAVAFVPSIVALQLIYFADFRRRQERVRVLAWREARLASFAADVLSDPDQVPELAAVTLVSDVLQADCSYVAAGDSQVVSRQARRRSRWNGDSEDVGEFQSPIVVSGASTGLLQARVVGARDDDRAFVAAVAAVLGSAMERSAAETRLRMTAVTDPVTGLPNWVLLQDRLQRLLARPQEHPLAVVCCDVRGLKDINDEYGRDVGDQVLTALARRLEDVTSPEGTVARIGADEFIVVEPGRDAPATEALARRLGRVAEAPVAVGPARIDARLSVGFTVADSADRNAGRLVRDAEMAVMVAKRQRAATAVYSDRVRNQLVGRRRMIRELCDAIESNQITVAYQPIVDLRTQRIAAVEALARWADEQGRAVPPAMFVQLAEESGTIGALSGVVFERAVSDLAHWSATAPALAQLRLSLNLAPSELSDHELSTRLQGLLARYAIAPERITLEVTESGLQQATDATARQLARIRVLGVGLSLDDFGTGYSTLTRLMAFPVTELKIDRQFTTASQGSARLIVPAVVGLAHASGLAVVMEGIETEAQRDLVVANGCDFGQGYLFSPPVPAEAVPTVVEQSVRSA